ncbi:hypothetical protein [Rubrobacter naiadicus]|uniref:hypothetical protein n=1 Tax=Rubrobacter naiadicus TaxID=1392641 RepID=UPI0023617E67|nr:hypothetical protein [Rubrobacter naiadicus]
MSGILFWASTLSLVLGAVVSVFRRKRSSAQLAFVLGAVGGAFAITTGLLAIFGHGFGAVFTLGYGLGLATVSLGGFSGLFVLTAGFVLLPTSIYALGYEVEGPRWAYAALYDLLMMAALLLFVSDHEFLFLFFWELAAILFYGLVVFEDGREGRVDAGYLYSAASKLGTALIFAAFFLAFVKSGTFAFSGIEGAYISPITPVLQRDIPALVYRVWVEGGRGAAPGLAS